MTNLIPWEPMREMMTLREAMDRLFDDAFTRPFGLHEKTTQPAVDMYKTDHELVVKASIPGFKVDDVNISVNDDILFIRGETKQEDEQKDATYYMREQHYNAFERTIRLPAEVKADKADANFENGVLTITMPVTEEVKSKSIAIKVK